MVKIIVYIYMVGNLYALNKILNVGWGNEMAYKQFEKIYKIYFICIDITNIQAFIL